MTRAPQAGDWLDLDKLERIAEAVPAARQWYTPQELCERLAMPAEDGRHIAAFRPVTVIELIARLRAAEAENVRLREEAQSNAAAPEPPASDAMQERIVAALLPFDRAFIFGHDWSDGDELAVEPSGDAASTSVLFTITVGDLRKVTALLAELTGTGEANAR